MSFVMYVCPSVSVEQLNCQLTDKRKFSYRGAFVKICLENLGFVKTGHKYQELHVKTRVRFWLLLILSLPWYGIPTTPPPMHSNPYWARISSLSWLHSDTPRSVELRWKRDQLITETSACTTLNRHPWLRRYLNPLPQQTSGRRTTP
jgi:hypothetical protein